MTDIDQLSKALFVLGGACIAVMAVAFAIAILVYFPNDPPAWMFTALKVGVIGILFAVAGLISFLRNSK